ncbi:MATE family efflux transporter [Rubinisphaera italica]|nr:MATE family efflux transporter [Rubinisphaera italica]
MSSSTPVTRARPGSAQELLLIALPLMISFGSQSVMSFIDRIFLTWYSSSALAATMPASMLNWSIVSFAMGVASYTGTFISQYEGAGRKDRVARVVWQSIWLCLSLGSLLALFTLAAPLIFALAGHPADVQRDEVTYFSMLCGGAPAALLMTSLSSFFSGRGQTAVVMWVNLTAVLINLVFGYLLIFGFAFIPPLGIWGAGLATVISNCLACLLFVGLMIREVSRKQYPMRSEFGIDFELCQRMLYYGLAMGLQIFVDIFGFTIFLLFVGKMGTTALAATNLAFNLNSLAFIPMLGLGTAVMTLVGRRIGEKNPALAETTVRHALQLGCTYMGLWCVAYVLIPRLLITPFRAYAAGDEFAEIEETAVILMRFIAIYGLFDVLAIVYGYALRGAGDALYPFLFFTLSSIFCLIIPSAVIWYLWGGNLIGTWSVVTFYIFIVGIGMWWRYRGGKWKSMSVIEKEVLI